MLGQENQEKGVELSFNDVNNSNNNIGTFNGNASSNGGSNILSNSDEAPTNGNPLNDHDYCSPNKSSSASQKPKPDLQPFVNGSAKDTDPEPNNTASSTNTSDHTELQASSSSTLNDIKNRPAPDIKSKLFNEDDEDGDLSDNSLSSSSISSSDSAKNLIIAQDCQERKMRSLDPQNTPSVSRPKLGRRPVLKTDFETTHCNDQKQQSPRIRRPRQNTSVTDKSQWITGEEQIDSALSEHLTDVREKRQRKEVHDPNFSHYTSSDYSSSDAESDQESDENEEDDPLRPWCSCNKPYDGKFMISCDICEYWFHGNCVGVTKSLNERWSKDGKEWFCSDCSMALSTGTPRNAIPKKIVKKTKTKTNTKSSGKRRGRPRKSATPNQESATTRLSLRSAKKSSSSLDSRMSTRKSLTKSNVSTKSFNEFENPDRLKELIRERRKAFFLKHRLSEQLRAEKMKELNVGRRSLTATLGESLDSLVTSTNSPNMNCLPINIKSEHKEKSKPNIVLQINTKKDGGSKSDSQRIVTTIVKKRKHSESGNSVADELFTADPLKVSKKTKKEADKASVPVATSSLKVSGTTSPSSEDGKPHTSQTHRNTSKISNDQSASKKRRRDSESNSAEGSSNQIGSKQMIKMIQDSLEQRGRKLLGNQVSSEKVAQLAIDIQSQLNECYKEGTPKYLNKFRSLIFNLRDPKNEGLLTNVLSGGILPSKLVRMSHDDMASNELSEWRDRENKHSIELIKRDAQLAAEQVIVKKTHKGEEVISATTINETDNPATSATDNQELPTTPTKSSLKVDIIKSKSPLPALKDDSSKPAMSKISDATKQTEKIENSNKCTNEQVRDPLFLLDTTKDHDSHVFDIGCKICTKQQIATSNHDETKNLNDKSVIKKEKDQEKIQDQPKRLRISIDTRLDPSDLHRLKEPLVTPTVQPKESKDLSPSKTSPNAALASEDEEDDIDGEELYDPSTSTMPFHKLDESDLPCTPNPNEPCWSGTLNMSEIGKFSALAKPISGNLDFIRGKISPNLLICGRMAQDQLPIYIKQIKSTTKNQILLVQLHPLTENDKTRFDALFDYLYTRNRYGVIDCDPYPLIMKDFYILPIHEKSNIPDVLKPYTGSGLNRTVPNCLLGLIIKAKRRPSVSGSTSSYTPTPLGQ